MLCENACEAHDAGFHLSFSDYDRMPEDQMPIFCDACIENKYLLHVYNIICSVGGGASGSKADEGWEVAEI